MSFHVFKGHSAIQVVERTPPDPRLASALESPEGYIASEGLVNAVNVALAIGRPLLLTGEPGTGKTQLAYRLAAELGLGKPLRFNTKSSSAATELFYQFDTVAHFAASQLAALKGGAEGADEDVQARDYIRYTALGEAILRSHGLGKTAPYRPRPRSRDVLGADGVDPLEPVPVQPTAAVVLIDEIDKAPRDFPNDLLNQIENLEFAIPELGIERIRAERAFQPVIVITSNSEKQLPEAFLRRCVYHHIEFPGDEAERRKLIQRILDERLKGAGVLDGEGFEDALKIYFHLRDLTNVEKKPSTSELLDWIQGLLRRNVDWRQPASAQLDSFTACLSALAKHESDEKTLGKYLELLSMPAGGPR